MLICWHVLLLLWNNYNLFLNELINDALLHPSTGYQSVESELLHCDAWTLSKVSVIVTQRPNRRPSETDWQAVDKIDTTTRL